MIAQTDRDTQALTKRVTFFLSKADLEELDLYCHELSRERATVMRLLVEALLAHRKAGGKFVPPIYLRDSSREGDTT